MSDKLHAPGLSLPQFSRGHQRQFLRQALVLLLVLLVLSSPLVSLLQIQSLQPLRGIYTKLLLSWLQASQSLLAWRLPFSQQALLQRALLQGQGQGLPLLRLSRCPRWLFECPPLLFFTVSFTASIPFIAASFILSQCRLVSVHAAWHAALASLIGISSFFSFFFAPEPAGAAAAVVAGFAAAAAGFAAAFAAGFAAAFAAGFAAALAAGAAASPSSTSSGDDVRGAPSVVASSSRTAAAANT